MELTKTPSFRLDGRRALVTGAGRGIGLAAASALADAGAHVTLAARTAKEIEEAADAIRARGQKAEPLALDVRDVEAAQKIIVAQAPFEILVNNRTAQPGGINFQQQQIRTAFEQTIGDALHLVRVGAVNEALFRKALRPVLPEGLRDLPLCL